MFPGPLSYSLIGKALRTGIWHLEIVDIRSFTQNKYCSVDSMPFGGGPGMIIRPDIIDAAMKANQVSNVPFIYLTPRGKILTQTKAQSLAMGTGFVLLCGRFEGVDQRVLDIYRADEISIGDYILSGGELAAFVLVDVVIRLIPGVIGKIRSLQEESFESGLLEYSHYTRPKVWEEQPVPSVLVSGHHQLITKRKKSEAEAITQERRPDLWKSYLEKIQRRKS